MFHGQCLKDFLLCSPFGKQSSQGCSEKPWLSIYPGVGKLFPIVLANRLLQKCCSIPTEFLTEISLIFDGKDVFRQTFSVRKTLVGDSVPMDSDGF